MVNRENLPYPRSVEILVVVSIWGGYAFLRFIQFYVQKSVPNHLSVDYTICCILFVFATFFVFWLCRVLRVGKMGWFPVILSHLLIAVAITSVVEVFSIYVKIVKVEYLNIASFIPESYSISSVLYFVFSRFKYANHVEAYLVVLAGGLGRDYFLRYTEKQARAHQLRERAHRLQNQIASARLDALRMQINPHFLFNTLHVINTMAGTNPDGVHKGTKRLSELLRYALSSTDQQEASLCEELKFLRGYFEIQKLRLRDQLEVEIDVDPAAQDALMPTLLLQPLAENAVKHGIQHVEGTGWIRVRIRRQKYILVVQVEDNGPGITGEPEDDGCVGLENVRERLTHLYGSDHALELGDSELGGCCVEVRLPYHTEQDLHLEAVPEAERSSASVSTPP